MNCSIACEQEAVVALAVRVPVWRNHVCLGGVPVNLCLFSVPVLTSVKLCETHKALFTGVMAGIQLSILAERGIRHLQNQGEVPSRLAPCEIEFRPLALAVEAVTHPVLNIGGLN